jgi:uncharacterized RDD family membrane protein YckC
VNITNTKEFISKRVLATLIDYTLVFTLSFLYIYIVGDSDNNGSHTVNGLPALFPILLWFVYFVICEAYFDGSFGHQLFKLKIITISGGKPDFGQVLTRRLADIIEITWCFGLIAFITANTTKYSQRLGDIWAKTTVIGKDIEIPSDKFDFEN